MSLSSISKEREGLENVENKSRDNSVEARKIEVTEESEKLNYPLPTRDRPQTRGVLKNSKPMDSIVEENRTAEK